MVCGELLCPCDLFLAFFCNLTANGSSSLMLPRLGTTRLPELGEHIPGLFSKKSGHG